MENFLFFCHVLFHWSDCLLHHSFRFFSVAEKWKEVIDQVGLSIFFGTFDFFFRIFLPFSAFSFFGRRCRNGRNWGDCWLWRIYKLMIKDWGAKRLGAHKIGVVRVGISESVHMIESKNTFVLMIKIVDFLLIVLFRIGAKVREINKKRHMILYYITIIICI